MLKYLLATAALAVSTPALADDTWWAAETDHFKVYSNGTQQDAETLAVSMERLDEAMRIMRNMPTEDTEVPDAAKLEVFQFGRPDDIAELSGNRRSGVYGFFIPRAGNSSAYVPLMRARDNSSPGTREGNVELTPGRVLFHEYAHYFMFQHGAAAYPFWYVEGFAELFGTADLVEDGFNIGEPPEHRATTLRRLNVSIERLLDPPDNAGYEDLMVQYAYGWLLSSYLSFEPSRAGQLNTYLRNINARMSNLDAARAAFGDLDQLERELNQYKNGRARAVALRFPNYIAPEAEVRQLDEAEAAQMMLHIRSTRGVSRGQARTMANVAQGLVQRYPTSLPVLLSAMEAAFDNQDLAEAESLADRALAIDPTAVKALIYKGHVAMEHAKQDPAYYAVARSHYIAANRIDSQQPQALVGYYRTYRLAGEQPPENALLALENAFDLAPFDQGIRRMLAHLLLLENRDREAVFVLGPIMNDPHDSDQAEELRELVDKLEAGDRQPLIDELAPKADEDDEDE